MKCENCGNIIEEKDNFCRKCGSAKLKIFARSNDENIEVVESYDLNNIDPIKIIDNDHDNDNEVPESENKELFEEVEKADKKSKNFILAGIITLMIILFLVILLIIIISYSLK